MWKHAPDGLKGIPQGAITYVKPGDVVSINDYHNGKWQPDGHVRIVSQVSGSAVTYVSQNAGTNTKATVITHGRLSGKKLTVDSSGTWTYQVLGIVHAPASGSGKSHSRALAFFANGSRGLSMCRADGAGFHGCGGTRWGVTAGTSPSATF